MLFADHFDQDAVGEFAFDQVYDAVLHQTLEDLTLRFRAVPFQWQLCALPALIPSLVPFLPHPPVHGVVGQAVGFLVAAAQGVAHFEFCQLARRGV